MGHRPAVTVLGAGASSDRRDEQAFASLQQWVAKGAHLLEVDLGFGPGDTLLLDAPPGWMAASICLAAWWVGAAVTDDASAAEIAIVHESRVAARREAGAGAALGWVIGDAVDGSTVTPCQDEPWSVAVQSFPDHPPPARARPDALAIAPHTGPSCTQAEVLAQARALPAGRLGLRVSQQGELRSWAVALAARPAGTGEPSVLLMAGDESQIAAERISAWV
jgi:hypothetical protein